MAYRRSIPVLLILLALACCSRSRPTLTRDDLMEVRAREDEAFVRVTREALSGLLDHHKAEVEAHKGSAASNPAIEALIISGGGDWGAFGAGVLKGWGRVDGPMHRPTFDAVTGVSTGAFIAPFAFLGDDESIETVVQVYRNPGKDWVRERGLLYFLPTNESFAEVPGLEREMRRLFDLPMVRRIAEAGKSGRMLVVNTTNIDDGGMHVWNLVTAAKRSIESGNPDHFHQILLASAGIPGAFPAREIDGALYVDGGVTGNVLYGGRTKEEDSLPAAWKRVHPEGPPLRIRYWVIFNNQLRPPPETVQPRWPAVIARSVSIAIRAATLTSLRHLYAQAEISRLKHGAEIEVRLIAIPDDWVPVEPGAFVKSTMNELTDLGEQMGADPSSWRTESP